MGPWKPLERRVPHYSTIMPYYLVCSKTAFNCLNKKVAKANFADLLQAANKEVPRRYFAIYILI